MHRSRSAQTIMMIESDKGPSLIAIARAAIGESFDLVLANDTSGNYLQEQGASFVTLKLMGNLRGCIGSLEAHRSLLEDVRANARAAAFRDPRFSPLTASEFAALEIEISLLSEPQTIVFSDETDALEKLRPGVDGVIFSYKQHRSTFLPQVWEQLSSPKLFMAHLKQKAGLPKSFWAPEVNLQRYTVSKWCEK